MILHGHMAKSLNYDYLIIDDHKGSELTYNSTLEFLYSTNLLNNVISREIPEEFFC